MKNSLLILIAAAGLRCSQPCDIAATSVTELNGPFLVIAKIQRCANGPHVEFAIKNLMSETVEVTVQSIPWIVFSTANIQVIDSRTGRELEGRVDLIQDVWGEPVIFRPGEEHAGAIPLADIYPSLENEQGREVRINWRIRLMDSKLREFAGAGGVNVQL